MPTQPPFSRLFAALPRAAALVLLASALSVGCATTEPKGDASPSAATAPKTAPQAVVDGTIAPLVWEVKKEGLPTSYLAGSFHFLRAGMTLPDAFETAWGKTETLVVELDTADPETQAMVQELMQKRMLMRRGDSLEAMMKPEAYKRLKGELAAMGLNPTLTNLLQPWAASVLLTDVKFQKNGFDATSGVEMRLGKRATAEKRTVVALESAAEQIDALASIEPKSAVASLELLTMTSDKQFTAEMEELATAWRTGDEPALYRLTFSDANHSEEAAKYLKTVIVDRNAVLGSRVARLLQDVQAHFVVVGAAHTVGPDSVLAVLKKEGFTVTRLPREPWSESPAVP